MRTSFRKQRASENGGRAGLVDGIDGGEPFNNRWGKGGLCGKNFGNDGGDFDRRRFEGNIVRQVADGAVVVVFEIAMTAVYQMNFRQNQKFQRESENRKNESKAFHAGRKREGRKPDCETGLRPSRVLGGHHAPWETVKTTDSESRTRDRPYRSVWPPYRRYIL